MSRRKIMVATTSRADYGLLSWLMRAIAGDRALELQLVASGSHLSRAFGDALGQIRRDGFRVAAKVPILPPKDDAAALAAAVGRGTAAFAGVIRRLAPDVLVVLGDRFELLAPCTAAVALRTPIAHIHGGESSEGVLDEQVRHAVTKLSHLHFAAAEPYRRRLLRMGEDPARIFNVGALGLEGARRVQRLGRDELERRLNFSLRDRFALLTFHPAGLSGGEDSVKTLDAALGALDRAGLRTIATYANADHGGRAVNRRLEEASRRRPGRMLVSAALGQQVYFSLLKHASMVIGNSSSGIIEVPSFRCPTVNIGDRQAGRLRAPSIIDCGTSNREISAALRRALSPRFRRERCRGKTLYGRGDSSARIIRVLKSVALGEPLLRKSFHEN